jgi:hypothetical protein
VSGTALIVDGQNEVTERACSTCKVVKPLGEFHRQKTGTYGRQSRCKPCASKATKDSRKKGGETRLAKRRITDRVRYQDPVRRRQKLNWEFKRRYGITLDEFEEIVAEQDGLCAICKREPVGEGNHGTLFQDHCHDLDLLRGAVCGPCNSGMGMFGDSIERLRAAADYLEFWTTVHAAQEVS